MPVISQSIKNLKGGISQQPNLLRYPEQGTTQINGWSSEASGLQKRPATVFKGKLDVAGAFGERPFIHTINRDLNERYNIVFTGTGIRAFVLGDTINEVVVHHPQGLDYITTQNPRQDLRCITIADYTFVVNRNKYVEEGTTTSNAGNLPADQVKRDALILCRGGQYGRTLKITIEGHTQEVVMPTGVDADPAKAAEMVKETDAQFILNKFKDLFEKDTTNFPTGWTFTVGSGYLHVQAPEGVALGTISTEDGYAGQLLSVVRREVSSISKLPIEAPDKYKVLVRGDTTKSGDAYYIEYNAHDKVWKESVGWGITTDLNASTMPWAIRRDENGEFTFQKVDGTNNFPMWAVRRAGDDDTNPMPSFVGQTINDVFLFRNRLGVLSGENIILSRTGHYFDFFPASVANIADDDAIDVAISHNRVSILKFAVPFNEQMLLWSDQAQFVFGAEGTLTSRSVTLDLATEFEVSDYCRPLGLGRSIYYVTPRSAFSSLNRYYTVSDGSASKDAEDVSSHIPFYIPNGAYQLYGSTTEDFISVLSENALDKIYIYKFKFQNDQRTQLSWSHWELGKNVKIWCASVIQSRVYIFAENATEMFAITVDLTKNTKDLPEEPYRTYIDFKKSFLTTTGHYNITTNKTEIVPHDIYGMSFSPQRKFVMVDVVGNVTEFSCPNDIAWNSEAKVYVNGDVSNQSFVVGFAYDFTYTFSQFLIKQTATDGSVQTMDTGRLQLRKAWVNYQDSGAFDVYVTNANRWEDDGLTPKPYIYTYSGPKINSPEFLLGRMMFASGQFKFPCPGNANEVEVTINSSSVNPISLIGAGWEGVHVGRSSSL